MKGIQRAVGPNGLRNYLCDDRRSDCLTVDDAEPSTRRMAQPGPHADYLRYHTDMHDCQAARTVLKVFARGSTAATLVIGEKQSGL